MSKQSSPFLNCVGVTGRYAEGDKMWHILVCRVVNNWLSDDGVHLMRKAVHCFTPRGWVHLSMRVRHRLCRHSGCS